MRSSRIAASRCSRGRGRACRSPGATARCAPSSSSSRASGSSASTSTRSCRCSPRTRCTSAPAPSGCCRPRSASEPSPARWPRHRSSGPRIARSRSARSASASSCSRWHRCTRHAWPASSSSGSGPAFTLFAANANALVQLAAPDHLRGRLVALYLFAFVGLAPFGSLLSGALVELGGTAARVRRRGGRRPRRDRLCGAGDAAGGHSNEGLPTDGSPPIRRVPACEEEELDDDLREPRLRLRQ